MDNHNLMLANPPAAFWTNDKLMEKVVLSCFYSYAPIVRANTYDRVNYNQEIYEYNSPHRSNPLRPVLCRGSRGIRIAKAGDNNEYVRELTNRYLRFIKYTSPKLTYIKLGEDWYGLDKSSRSAWDGLSKFSYDLAERLVRRSRVYIRPNLKWFPMHDGNRDYKRLVDGKLVDLVDETPSLPPPSPPPVVVVPEGFQLSRTQKAHAALAALEELGVQL